jgi:hypothetical protein
MAAVLLKMLVFKGVQSLDYVLKTDFSVGAAFLNSRSGPKPLDLY